MRSLYADDEMSGTIDRFVSCVVLCRSPADELERYITELSALLTGNFSDHEIVVINDGDEAAIKTTLDSVVDSCPYLRVLQLTQAKGDHVAATAGLHAAIGDYVCVLDSSNDPPELVPEAVTAAIQGADVVLGIDRNQSGRSLPGRVLEQLFVRYARRYLRLDIARGMGTFRCMSRYAVNALIRLSQPHRFYRVWGDYVGLSTAPRYYHGRSARRQRGLLESIDEALDIAVTTSPHPLRMVSGLAMLFALADFLYIAYILLVFVINPHVATGWTTLSLQIAASSLIIIVLLAATGEYLGRLLERASPNPTHWVREERSSKRFADERRNLRNLVEHSAVVDVKTAQR